MDNQHLPPEHTFHIPASLVKRKHGFSMDFGGSAIKVVCAQEDADSVRLDCLTFSHERAPEALAYIKNKLGPNINPDTKTYTTGIAASHFQQHIKAHLGVSIENLLEMDSFARGFLFLTENLPLSDLVHKDSEVVLKYAVDASIQFMEAMKSWSKDFDSGSKPWEISEGARHGITSSGACQESVQFPTMVVSCGSAAGAMKVEKDGKLDAQGIVTCGGRFFASLGSLLTGVKTYDELVAMAARGDAGRVDILSNQMGVDAKDDVYSKFAMGTPLYAFGHALGKNLGDFNEEDIAAALLSHVAQQVAGAVHQWAIIDKVPQVFFCGGFTKSQVVRDEIAKHFAHKSMMNKQGFHSQHYFLKLGSYIGCLGALITTLTV